MNKKLLLAGFALALSACGTPKKSADSADNGRGGTNQGQGGSGARLSQADFEAKCTAKSPAAFTSSDMNFCLVPTSLSLPDGYAATKVLVDANYHAGKYIVAHGTRGATFLTLGNTRVGNDINYRALGPLLSGALNIQVVQGSNSKADVTTYECFDYNVNAIYCNDGVIP